MKQNLTGATLSIAAIVAIAAFRPFDLQDQGGARRPEPTVFAFAGCVRMVSPPSPDALAQFVLAEPERIAAVESSKPSSRIAIVGSTTAGTTPATAPMTVTPPSTTSPTMPPGMVPTPSTPSPSQPITAPELPETATIVGETGGATAEERVYRLTGFDSDNLRNFVNQRVEIRGTFKKAAAAGASGRPARGSSAAPAAQPSTLQVISIRPVSGICEAR